MRLHINPTNISETILNGIDAERQLTGLTVAELCDSPRIRILKMQNDFYEDIADDIFDKIVGSALLEKLIPEPARADRYLKVTAKLLRDISDVTSDPQQKMIRVVHYLLGVAEVINENFLVQHIITAQIKGREVKAVIPIFDKENGILTNYKFCSSQKWLHKPTRELWKKELNVLTWILEQGGHEVKEIKQTVLISNWRAYNEGMCPSGYPRTKLFESPVEMMDANKLTNFILTQMSNHISAETKLPLCSGTDLWAKGSVYKVTRLNSMKSLREETNEKIIDDYITKNYKKERHGLRKITVPGKATRCPECLVKDFCEQYKKDARKETLKKENL